MVAPVVVVAAAVEAEVVAVAAVVVATVAVVVVEEVAAAETVEIAAGVEDVGVVIGTRIANTAERTTTRPDVLGFFLPLSPWRANARG
jgi:hypothetical protein